MILDMLNICKALPIARNLFVHVISNEEIQVSIKSYNFPSANYFHWKFNYHWQNKILIHWQVSLWYWLLKFSMSNCKLSMSTSIFQCTFSLEGDTTHWDHHFWQPWTSTPQEEPLTRSYGSTTRTPRVPTAWQDLPPEHQTPSVVAWRTERQTIEFASKWNLAINKVS